MGKQKQHLYLRTNASGLHVDIARDVCAIYNDVLSYEHFFSSKLFSASCFLLLSIIAWYPNKALFEKNETVEDWRRSALPQSGDHREFPELPFNVAVLTAPLVSAAKPDGTKKEQYGTENLCMCYSVCSHQEATRGSLFSPTDETIKKLIAQGTCLLRKSHFSENLSQSITNVIIGFGTKSNELLSRFFTACLQAFNGRKQPSRNLYLCFLRYGAIFASKGKEVGF